ncbi:MAG: HEAT repeat domain-containing protein [Polyangiaceae bacterium]|nr:HEAT repeat domain-containing protein [Polyangiaceae bacterium]
MIGKRPLVVIACVALLLAAGVAVLLLRSQPAPAASGAASAGPPVRAPFAFRWPAGTVYQYGLSFEVDGAVAPPSSDRQSALSTSLALTAELALRSYGRLERSGDYVLGVRLTSLTKLDLTFGEEPVLPDGGRSFVGRELALVVGPDGTFRSLHVAADEPPMLVNVLRSLLGALEVVVSEGKTWAVSQTNATGDVRVLYEVRADDPESLGLRRRAMQYTRLAAGPVLGDATADVSGAFEVVLDRAGHVERIEGRERLSAKRAQGNPALRQDTRLEFRLLSITQVAPEPSADQRLVGLKSTGLGDVTTSGEIEDRLLEQRAGELTMERIVEDLLVYGPAPDFPDAGRWMWQATGFLLLHPEKCRDLGRVFKKPEMGGRGRGRVLDLLASTGNPEAQTVLRELLETKEARGSDHYATLVQRLSPVQRPTSETVEYLRDKVEQGDGKNTLAAAHALGAAIGNRWQAEGGAVDARSAALLRQGLAAAKSPQEKADWLGTLGNAGLVEDVPLIAGHATDGDRDVREAAANALRKTQAPASESALLGLASDADSRVRDRALHTLTEYKLAPAHLDALRQAVASGALPQRNYPMLMTLLEQNRHQPEAVMRVLAAMLEQNVADRRLLQRIRAPQKNLTTAR